jgi:23S rRNA (adenine2503-C2)-methyltransferase
MAQFRRRRPRADKTAAACDNQPIMHRPVSLYEITRRELPQQFAAWQIAPAHAARLWSYLYREQADRFDDMQELPLRVRQRLVEHATLPRPVEARRIDSTDALTHKFLLELADGRQVETVLMRYERRTTACLSSQVGCALACVFCATGQQGFTRNLTAAEIVGQALHVERQLRRSGSQRLQNLVLMGMGEPLLNYEAVNRSLEILSDPGGLAIGAKQITVSTVGVVPGIVRLADEARPWSLAVSLHAAEQAERAAMVPAARTWPLDELMDACRYYAERRRRKVFFEWTLIAGVNDQADHARRLADLLRGIESQVNLIPLNATEGYEGDGSSVEAIDRFRSVLREGGIAVSVRQKRGVDIAAACGQLAGTVD